MLRNDVPRLDPLRTKIFSKIKNLKIAIHKTYKNLNFDPQEDLLMTIRLACTYLSD